MKTILGEVIEMLLEAPDSQLDSSVFPLIEGWDNPPTSLQILEVLDKCVYYGLASGFVIDILDTLLNDRLEDEGKTLHDIEELATWRV
jgi:hypothetical protein